MPQKIVIIEDDAPFRRIVARVLDQNGYSAAGAGTGKEGIDLVRRTGPDLVILDLVLPGMQGLDVCQALKQRKATADIPILILTANDGEGLDIVCLDMGADDFLTKPVDTDRLLAYCRALLRRSRSRPAPEADELKVGPLRLDFDRKVVRMGDAEHPHLTPKEFGLLYELASCSPKPVDRRELYKRIWGMEPPSDASLKTVEVHVRRIRLKLRWRSDEWIVAVHGRGYCLTPP